MGLPSLPEQTRQALVLSAVRPEQLLDPSQHDGVVSEEVEWGLIDHDEMTDEIVAVEIWSASKRLPKAILDTSPHPARTGSPPEGASVSAHPRRGATATRTTRPRR